MASRRESGGSTSEKQRATSGSGTGPAEVGGYDVQSHNKKRIDYLEKRVEEQKVVNNQLSDRIRKLAKEGQEKVDSARSMLSQLTDELINARLTADKYIQKCDGLKDRVEELEAQLEEYDT